MLQPLRCQACQLPCSLPFPRPPPSLPPPTPFTLRRCCCHDSRSHVVASSDIFFSLQVLEGVMQLICTLVGSTLLRIYHVCIVSQRAQQELLLSCIAKIPTPLTRVLRNAVCFACAVHSWLHVHV